MNIKGMIASLIKKLTSSVTKSSNKQGDSETKMLSLFAKFLALPTPIKVILLGGVIVVLFMGGILLTTGSQGPKAPPPKVCSTDQSSTTNANDGTATGDWTKDGTSANKVAKQVWDFWNKKGYSAAAIAGVLGSVEAESGFNPLVAQGGGSMLKDTPQGGGGGLYQFTPYSKFAAIGSDKWKDPDAQGDYVWTSEAHAFSGYATITNVSDAVSKWCSLYERGAVATAHMERRVAAAEQAYKMWGSTASQTGSESTSVIGQSSDTANSALANAQASASNDCQTQGNTVDGSIAKLFDDNYKGLTLNAGLDDPNHVFINEMNGGPGVHGPGAHDGWDVNSIGDPSGSAEENIYAIAGGKIAGLSRGENGSNLTITIQLSNGNYLQYQEFKTGSIPSDLQKDKSIKAGTKIGNIGSAAGTGGVHSGAYVHISYYSKDVKLNGNGGVEHYGAIKDTMSLGELLGIKADKWVAAPKQYTWSDMTALKNAG